MLLYVWRATHPKHSLGPRSEAAWLCNRGLPYKQKLKQTDRYADHLLRALGKHKLANKIRMGMPSSSDDEVDVKASQPKRKRRKVESESDDAIDTVASDHQQKFRLKQSAKRKKKRKAEVKEEASVKPEAIEKVKKEKK